MPSSVREAVSCHTSGHSVDRPDAKSPWPPEARGLCTGTSAGTCAPSTCWVCVAPSFRDSLWWLHVVIRVISLIEHVAGSPCACSKNRSILLKINGKCMSTLGVTRCPSPCGEPTGGSRGGAVPLPLATGPGGFTYADNGRAARHGGERARTWEAAPACPAGGTVSVQHVSVRDHQALPLTERHGRLPPSSLRNDSPPETAPPSTRKQGTPPTRWPVCSEPH